MVLSGLGQRLGLPRALGLGRQLGVSCAGGRGGGGVLPLPCLPVTNTRTFTASQKGPWEARVAFKISFANQIWLFQEAPSLTVPLAGRVQGGTSTFQGPWLGTPVA